MLQAPWRAAAVAGPRHACMKITERDARPSAGEKAILRIPIFIPLS
jgi:hypothetical protein